MWEPQLDADKLIDEFLRGYYGETVAPLLKQYWNVLIAQAEKEKIYLGCFGMNSAKWIDLATLNRVTELMNRAVATATSVYGPDSAELRRLQKSKMGVDHVWLTRYYPLRCEAREKKQPFLGPKDPLKAAEEFAGLCKRFKTSAAVISQEKNLGQYLEGLKAGFIAQQNPPEMCKGLLEDSWIAFDALSFANYRNAATVVEDKEGWNGKSVRMGTKVDWNTSYTPPVRGRYRILASLRCEGTLKQGKLGSWGVYDVQGKKGLKTMTPRPKISRPPTARSTKSSAGSTWAWSTSFPAPTSGLPTATAPSWTPSSSTGSCSSKQTDRPKGFRTINRPEQKDRFSWHDATAG